MMRRTLLIGLIILLLGAVVGTAAGILSYRIDGGNVWPTVCAQAAGGATTCLYATPTAPVWSAETAAAVATWEAGRPRPAP